MSKPGQDSLQEKNRPSIPIACRNLREEMHTPLDAPCYCKPARSAYRLEQVSCHGLQRVPRETSQDPLPVGLAASSRKRGGSGGLGMWKAEGLEMGQELAASAPLCSVPEAPLPWPVGRNCA